MAYSDKDWKAIMVHKLPHECARSYLSADIQLTINSATPAQIEQACVHYVQNEQWGVLRWLMESASAAHQRLILPHVLQAPPDIQAIWSPLSDQETLNNIISRVPVKYRHGYTQPANAPLISLVDKNLKDHPQETLEILQANVDHPHLLQALMLAWSMAVHGLFNDPAPSSSLIRQVWSLIEHRCPDQNMRCHLWEHGVQSKLLESFPRNDPWLQEHNPFTPTHWRASVMDALMEDLEAMEQVPVNMLQHQWVMAALMLATPRLAVEQAEAMLDMHQRLSQDPNPAVAVAWNNSVVPLFLEQAKALVDRAQLCQALPAPNLPTASRKM